MEKRVMRPRPEEVLPETRRVLARAGCPPDRGEAFVEIARAVAGKLITLAKPAAFSVDLPVMGIGPDIVELDGLTISSSDMVKKLSEAETVSLFLATIGAEPEEECRALGEGNRLIEALLLDSAASEMVERLLRLAHLDTAKRMSGFVGTARYAPGYGDFSLSHQVRIVEVLGGDETGVRVMQDSFMLIPKKSTTGIIGWKRQRN
ncbi:MAG: hypothetical protein ACP5QG_01050 [candidate division WOR-3 bacterium]